MEKNISITVLDLKMNITRVFAFLTIFGLLFFTTIVVHGEEDIVDADVAVDEEDEPSSRTDDIVTPPNDTLEGKEDEDSTRIPSSPDFRTVNVFIQPARTNELIAGKLTRLLVGARNNGTQSFVVESIDGSLRYPQDFTYYIQNFTSLRSDKVLEPGLEATFEYLFMPSETFNGRPMGLVVLINYRNNEGKQFQNVVFNQTINLIDADEGFDGETFFLYVFLFAILVLLGFLGYQYLLSNRVKRMSGKQGSQSLVGNQQTRGSYDPDWIPKHHLPQNRSPKKSPRERKSRQANNDVNGTASAGAVSKYDVRNDNKDKLYSLSLCLDVKYMRHRLLLFKNIPTKRQMASLANTVVDIKVGTEPEESNPAAFIPPSMVPFIENEKLNLKQIASNFLPRHFEFRTKEREKKIHVVQLMSEYDGNFSTPVCYLNFYLKRAGKFIQFAEELGPLTDFLQRYTDLIGAIQTHESTCNGRLFRRSIERMQPEIAHVPMNLHLQQLLVSNDEDPSQKAIYNTVTLGAPAVHHSRFATGGLARMKANISEKNKRLCFLQDKLQDVLVLNSDIDDALDHLTHILDSPSTNIDRSVLKLSLQRVVKAVFSLLEYSTKDLDSIANSTGQVVINPLISKVPSEEVLESSETIQSKARKFLEEIKQSINKNEQTFNMAQLNSLKTVASELERHTCKHIIRYIFQESQEIERYPEAFRERFDIAFSQALTCLIFSVYVLLSSVKISDQAWKLYINNGEYIRLGETREEKSRDVLLFFHT
ncbi:unnamed protein product [Adineta ricciae]|uniref:Translocon-associated protein subunit alpha n=1 Tax=Adineta ricciae TaxID=249248 RepID=A0A814SLX9_ADIRI|nr:unnamed protein product [Adineta ricciae]